MVDPVPTTPRDVLTNVTAGAMSGGDNKVSVEKTNGTVAPNEAAPRSDTPAAAGDATAPGTASSSGAEIV